MSAYPPPPAGTPVPPPQPGAGPAVKAPPIGWLVPLGGLLGLLGAILPWFAPVGTVDGQDVLKGDSLHSWDDGRIGLIGPILLVVAGVLVAQLLFGKVARRVAGGTHPFSSAGRWSLIAGAVAIACVVIAWFLLPSQYKIPGPSGEKLSWDDAVKLAKSEGVNLTMSRGPGIGFWLTIGGAVLALVGGALLFAAGKKAAAAAPPVPPPPAPVAQPPYGGQPYGAPPYGAAQPYGAPAQPYGPPAQPGVQPPSPAQ